MYAEGLDQSHAGFLVVDSVSVNSCELRLVDSVGFLCNVLDPYGSHNPSAGFPKLGLISDCFHQWLDEASLMTSGIGANL